MPITIIKGGISPIKTVISKPNKPIVPKDHVTAMTTTTMEIRTTLNDLKKKKSKDEVTIMASKTNNNSSDFTLFIVTERINGKPEKCKFSNKGACCLAVLSISSIKVPRSLELKISLLTKSIIR